MRMEDSILKTMAYSFAILTMYTLSRVVYSVWWRPKSLEKQLRRQGIRGTHYKLLFGDAKAMKQSFMEARSKPMALNHSIVPRVIPFYHEMAQKYGKPIIILLLVCCLFLCGSDDIELEKQGKFQ